MLITRRAPQDLTSTWFSRNRVTRGGGFGAPIVNCTAAWTAASKFNAMTLESLGMHETAKANGAVTLSSRLFRQLNDELPAEWERIKRELKICAAPQGDASSCLPRLAAQV